MKYPSKNSELYLNFAQVTELTIAIQVLLASEGLPTSDRFISGILLYPRNDLLHALSSCEEAAIRLPSIQRDPVVEVQDQLAAIFAQTFNQLKTSDALSAQEKRALQRVMNQFKEEIEGEPSLEKYGIVPPQAGNNCSHQ